MVLDPRAKTAVLWLNLVFLTLGGYAFGYLVGGGNEYATAVATMVGFGYGVFMNYVE